MRIYCWSTLKFNTHLVHRGGLLDYFECKSGFPKFINRNVWTSGWKRGPRIKLIREVGDLISVFVCRVAYRLLYRNNVDIKWYSSFYINNESWQIESTGNCRKISSQTYVRDDRFIDSFFSNKLKYLLFLQNYTEI